MTTEVVMKRELFGGLISQKSKSEMFSATDIVRAGNEWRHKNKMSTFNLSQWLNTAQTKEFIKSLQEKYGDEVYIKGRGRSAHTWVHPFLFIDLALAISPKLKIEVYSWLYDHLLKYRNDSGDSYKEMAGALYLNSKNKTECPKYICEVANGVRLACGVEDWQKATEKQLEKRDQIHKNIALLCDVLKDNDRAIEYGIKKAEKA